jgi:hypothetical protein
MSLKLLKEILRKFNEIQEQGLIRLNPVCDTRQPVMRMLACSAERK